MNNIFNFVNPRYELKTTKKKEKKEYGIDIKYFTLRADTKATVPMSSPEKEIIRCAELRATVKSPGSDRDIAEV